MLKHVLKACAVLAIVCLSSTNVSAQTNFTIINDGTCEFEYLIYYGTAGCTGATNTIGGVCQGSSMVVPVIPGSNRFIKIYIHDPNSTNSATVYESSCGSSTGSYSDCNSTTEYISYNSSNSEINVGP